MSCEYAVLLPMTICGTLAAIAGFFFVWLERKQGYRMALERIAQNGVNGSAWCVAVAEECLRRSPRV